MSAATYPGPNVLGGGPLLDAVEKSPLNSSLVVLEFIQILIEHNNSLSKMPPAIFCNLPVMFQFVSFISKYHDYLLS